MPVLTLLVALVLVALLWGAGPVYVIGGLAVALLILGKLGAEYEDWTYRRRIRRIMERDGVDEHRAWMRSMLEK